MAWAGDGGIYRQWGNTCVQVAYDAEHDTEEDGL